VPIAPKTFGENKTYRGVVCVALGTALGFVVVAPKCLELSGGPRGAELTLAGFLVGGAAMMAELPNSLLKRRLGIPPGAQAGGALGVAFHLLDQVDVVVGAWLVLAQVVQPTVARLAGSLAMVYVGHQVLSLMGYWLGMRATPR
jgi:hypothetical protein